MGTDLGESHTFQYTIDISPPPKKKKTKPAKQRVSITPEERAQRRRAYEQARNQLPHRRELKRRKEKERHEQAKELGLCRTCRSPAMPGRTRCQDCIEKRRLQQIQAREKAIQQKQGTLGQPPPDRTRAQTDERKKLQRLYKRRVRQEHKAAGLCLHCSQKAITGQTRCEVCRDKHRVSR